MSEIQKAIDQNRRDLINREKQASADITRSWRDVGAKIEHELSNIDLDNEWERYRLESLLRQTNAEAARYARGPLKSTIDRYTLMSQQHGESEGMRLLKLQLPPDLELVSFNTLPARAFEIMHGTTNSGPLANILASFGPDVESGMRQKLLEGIALGQNPRVVARNIVNELGVAKNRAERIARTEIIRAYRESSREVYRNNSNVISHYTRVSALDDRTCLTCWALHGETYSLNEAMESHVMCRCTLTPITVSWASMGFVGIPETHYTTPSGSEIFRNLDPNKQRKILGKSAFESYQRGDVDITDFVGRKHSPEWGTTIYRQPNKVVIPNMTNNP